MKINIIDSSGKLAAIIPIENCKIDIDHLEGCKKGTDGVGYINIHLTDEYLEPKPPFTWSDQEDPILYNNGKRVAIILGRSKAAQRFVEQLSNDIGHKCDFAVTAGRIHIDVMAPGVEAVREKLNDHEYMKQFIVPYSKESYDNETYFEIGQIL